MRSNHLRAIDFLGLLNKGEHDVFNYLFPFFGPSIAKPFFNDDIELYLFEYGLDVFYSDGSVGDSVVEAFMFHAKNSEEHEAFCGELPNGIVFGMEDEEVAEILGTPTRRSIPFSWKESNIVVHPLTLSHVFVYDYGKFFWTFNFAENRQLVKINIGLSKTLKLRKDCVAIPANIEGNNIVRTDIL